MLTGAAVLVCQGELIFDLWLGTGNFIGYGILLLFVTTETLGMQSFIIATASRATEDEVFAVSTVTGGILKLVLSISLVSRFGLLGVALGTAVALLLTNHWYMVYRGLRRLRFSYRDYTIRILLPFLLLFPAMLFVLFGVRELADGLSPLVQIQCVLGAALLLFGGAAWWLVLEPSQRVRFLSVIGFAGWRTLFAPRSS